MEEIFKEVKLRLENFNEIVIKTDGGSNQFYRLMDFVALLGWDTKNRLPFKFGCKYIIFTKQKEILKSNIEDYKNKTSFEVGDFMLEMEMIVNTEI